MAGNQYYGTIDPIAKAYQNDPRTKLAAAALAQGTSTAPVAQGGWGATDGLARAAQAILGAVQTKNNDAKYANREIKYMADTGAAAALASAAQRPVGLEGAAAALAPPQPVQPPQSAQMAPMAPPPAPTPQSAPMPPPGMPAGLPSGSMPTGNPLTPPMGGAAPGFPNGGTGPSRGAPLPAPGGDGVVAPTMEAVPSGPAPAPVSQPAAPTRPAEVVSNRIAMAQQLLASGNPDVAAIAQTYLDKGLDEQNTARLKASDQEFTQGQTGYKAGLDDYNSSRSDERQDAYTGRREAIGRNFQREETYGNQKFQAGQAGIDRSFRRSERQATQAFDAQQRISGQAFQSSENAKNRANSLEVAGIKRSPAAARSAYFSTPTGLKMQAEAGNQINANNDAIGKFNRFLSLNEKQGTGGAALNTPGIAAAYRWANSDLTEMNSIANDTTLAKIGGSLGTAISDGDRKFITESNISTANPHKANINMARATIGALKRKNDYLVSFANAQADGGAAEFARDWGAFAESTPIVQRDRRGNAKAVDNPQTFEQWKNSRPQYDASGNRVR